MMKFINWLFTDRINVTVAQDSNEIRFLINRIQQLEQKIKELEKK